MEFKYSGKYRLFIFHSRKYNIYSQKPEIRVKIYTDDFRTTPITNNIDYNRLIEYYVIDFNTNLQYIPSTGDNPIQWVQYPSISGQLQQNRSSLTK